MVCEEGRNHSEPKDLRSQQSGDTNLCSVYAQSATTPAGKAGVRETGRQRRGQLVGARWRHALLMATLSRGPVLFHVDSISFELVLLMSDRLVFAEAA